MKGMRAFLRRYGRNRAALGAAAVLALVVLSAIVGPLLYAIDPFDMVGLPYATPFGEFPLGTDVSGRDILAGILNGARISLLIGVTAALTATTIGVALGALAGYYGGLIDDLLMRTTEFFLTIPSFVFALVLVAIFSPTVVSVTAAIAVVSWPSMARLVRGEFIAQRGRTYVQACRALGMPDWEIILRQIPPERAAARHRRRIAHRGDRDPHRIGSLLPRPERPERGDVGLHGRRRAHGALRGPLDDLDPRPCHPHHRARDQSRG